MTGASPSGMKRGVLAAAVVAILAGAGGYWAGHKSTGQTDAEPPPATAGEPAKKERKLRFYRNPMGLPDTSPVPKKDPMGMDYIPVYEGEQDEEAGAAHPIRIGTEKVQKLGVKTEVASLRVLDKIVRAAGRIEPDERRTYTITPKFEGYVERLYVNATGQPVRKGQALFEVYSADLVSAQREYAIAADGVRSLHRADEEAQSGMKQLADSSLARLKNWDISEEQVKALAKSGETKRTLTFLSPVNGIVTEKKVVQGMRFVPGEALYQIADLSAVWVVADVFEQDIGRVKSGAKAKVKIGAYPDKTFEGVVTYVYPILTATTRSVPVRIELANPGAVLKPGLFAQVELSVSAKGSVVTVPLSAVIDSGTRQIVLIQAQEGRYEPREVKLGVRSDHYVEVLDGVRNGELVVVSANFLIDAESNLKAAVGGFGPAAHDGKTSPTEGAAKPASGGASYHVEGKVEEIDAKTGAVSISHGPVASLKWPAMTMEFKVADESLRKTLKPGAKVAFEFVERQPGEWVVTTATPLAPNTGASAPASPAGPHAGH